jgi:hypothetical protein
LANTDTLLGTIDKKDISIVQYLEIEKLEDKNALAKFFYNRLFDRYLKPFTYSSTDYKKEYKNGFSIMANCCLLIETFMSFREKHLIDTNRLSNECFRLFFTQSERFEIFSKDAFDKDGRLKTKKEGGRPNEFYSNVRCGILHTGETKDGWKIKRDIRTPLLDERTKTINATKFADTLKKELDDYVKKLKKSEWTSKEWTNFRLKMADIIKNCK